MTKIKTTAFLFIFIFGLGCSTRQKLTKTDFKKDFAEFSKKFYSDSLFQISSINFPLKGSYNIAVPITEKNAMGDSIISDWKKKDWRMITNNYFPNNEGKVVIDNSNYIREIKIRTKSAVIRTYIQDSGFEVIEKYAFRKGKWYLVYFSSMNY